MKHGIIGAASVGGDLAAATAARHDVAVSASTAGSADRTAAPSGAKAGSEHGRTVCCAFTLVGPTKAAA